MNAYDFDPVVNIDKKKFTDTERNLILKVVARDEDIRRQEKNRIRDLKEEIRELRERGVPDDEEEAYGRVCKRCRTSLGLFFNSGALCPNCEKKVCKSCRVPSKSADHTEGWLCSYCGKIRDIKAESGAWFYDQKVKPEKKRKVYGSLLIKRIFSTRQKKSDNLIFQDPEWSDIIEAVEEGEEGLEDPRDEGYVLVTSDKKGEYSAKEGNLSDLLSSKAVLGLENARVLTRAEYQKFKEDEHSETEGKQKDLVKKITKDKQNVQEPKSLLALSKSIDNPETDDRVRHVSFSPGDERSKDEEDHGIEMKDIERNSSPSNAVQADDSNVDDGVQYEENGGMREEANIDDLHSDGETNAEQRQDDDSSDDSEAPEKSSISSGLRTDDESGEYSEDVSQSDRELKQFAEDGKNISINKIAYDLQEDVLQRPDQLIHQPPKENYESESDLEIDFSAMRRKGEVVTFEDVEHNDRDLKDLHKTFVRKKKLKIKKLKTEEHGSEDTTDDERSSSSDEKESDGEFLVRQAGQKRKSSMEEELETFSNALEKEEGTKFEMLVDEDIAEKPARDHINIKEEESDDGISDLNIDFKVMKKKEDLGNQVNVSDAENDDGDDENMASFFRDFTKPNKIKFGKVRTEEHSDKDQSSSSSSEEEETSIGKKDGTGGLTKAVSHSDEDLRLFASSNQFVNFSEISNDFQEDVLENPSQILCQPPKQNSDIEGDLEIDFKSMQKNISVKTFEEVGHNDKDLKGLHETFVGKKRFTFNKLKTEEHDSGSSTDDERNSSSDDAETDGEFVVRQAVQRRKSTSDEELEKFVICTDKVEEKRFEFLEEEHIVKKPEIYQVDTKEDYDMERLCLDIDFKAMQKINQPGSSKVLYGEGIDGEDDENDVLFFQLFSKYSKRKLRKLRTDEHSDGDQSSGSSCDESQERLPFRPDRSFVSVTIAQSQVPKTVANGGTVKASHEPSEEENLDIYFSEFKENTGLSGSVESLGSNFSDEYIQQASNVAGEIMLGFKYDEREEALEVQVHRAKDLVVADHSANSTDPYVKVYLDPDAPKKGGKRKTKAKKHSLNPEFDEVLIFSHLSYDDVITRSCLVSIWHNDFYKNIRLGEVRISMEEHVKSGFSLAEPFGQWYTLAGKVMQKEHVEFRGALDFQLCYKPPATKIAETKKQSKLSSPTKGDMYIIVKKAQGLTQVTGNNQESKQPNPFVKITFISDVLSKTKYKTKFMRNTTEPVWEEEFLLKGVTHQTLRNTTMQMSVWNYEKGSKHILLGGIRLGVGEVQGDLHDSFGEEFNVWKRFLDYPNESLDFSVPLRSTLESVKRDRYLWYVQQLMENKMVKYWETDAQNYWASVSAVVAPPDMVKTITVEEHDKIKGSKKGSISSQSSLSKRFLNADTMSLASSGSMLSLYSNAGGEHSDIIIVGEILFSMKYDENSGIFSVTIAKAKGIAAVNVKQQTSDPYVKVYLLPDKSKSSKKKTTHRRKTLNPQWDETIKYKISRQDLLKRTLQVSIWNHDRFGRNDFLGEVQINMKHYQQSNDIEKDEPVWYTLQEQAPISIGDADESKGVLVLGLKYAEEKLTVLLKEARHLPAADAAALSNPFIKCYLLPDKSRRSKRKTSVKKNTLNPAWNERMEYSNLTIRDLEERVLEITVWDHDSSGHQFLGGVRCGLPQGDEYWHDCFGKEVDIWEGMMTYKGIYAEYTVPLRSTMASRKTQDVPMITDVLNNEMNRAPDSPLPRATPSITISLNYETLENMDLTKKKKKKDGDLRVVIKCAKNLEEESSTFAKLTLLPKKKSLKMKTNTHPNSADPVWDQEFRIEDTPLGELRSKTLEVMIYEVGPNKKEQELGFVHLGFGAKEESWDDSIGREVYIWETMYTQPNNWVTKEIPLRLVKDFNKDQKKGKNPDEMEGDPLDDFGNEGKESPRTSALRAMGRHASDVIDILQTREERPVTSPYSSSQDALDVIEEESETEKSVETPQSPINHFTVPTISISSGVEPGDAPFPGAGYEPVDEYRNKPTKKKENPGVSFLKRSPSQSSLASVYSTDSANIYDQVPIRGDIQFALKYDQNISIFEVHVYQARDIAAADAKRGMSDPYCKVYLLPDKTKRGKRKTKTRKKTINPDWEEVLEYKISNKDLRTRTLWISVWHQERVGRNIFLGEVMLNLEPIMDNMHEPIPRWYTLCEKGSAPMAELYKGYLKIALMFEDQQLHSRGMRPKEEDDEEDGKKKKKKAKKKKKEIETNGIIHLHIKEGSDLPSADKDGLSDPFCKCYLLPLKQAKTKRKTPVIRHTKDPIWDYKTEYSIDYEELLDHGIELTVWDWDRGSSNDFLGCSRLNMGCRSRDWDDAEGVEIEAWKHLIDSPNKWKDFVIPLRSKTDYKKT